MSGSVHILTSTIFDNTGTIYGTGCLTEQVERIRSALLLTRHKLRRGSWMESLGTSPKRNDGCDSLETLKEKRAMKKKEEDSQAICYRFWVRVRIRI